MIPRHIGALNLSLTSLILTMKRQGHFFDEISGSFTVQFICDVEFAGPLFSWALIEIGKSN